MSGTNAKPYRGLLPRGYRRIIARGPGLLILLLIVLSLKSGMELADSDFESALDDMEFEEFLSDE